MGKEELPCRLSTERLQLRGLRPSDSAFVRGLVSDPEVRRFLGGPVPEEQLAATVQRYLSISTPDAVWVVTTNSARDAVGLVFLAQHRDGAELELSYQFAASVWRMGIAFEATRRVLRHAFEDLEIPRVIAETQTANHASTGLLARLGMEPVREVERFGAQQTIYAVDRLTRLSVSGGRGRT